MTCLSPFLRGRVFVCLLVVGFALAQCRDCPPRRDFFLYRRVAASPCLGLKRIRAAVPQVTGYRHVHFLFSCLTCFRHRYVCKIVVFCFLSVVRQLVTVVRHERPGLPMLSWLAHLWGPGRGEKRACVALYGWRCVVG